MKRPYSQVGLGSTPSGFTVLLDGKNIRTPMQKDLVVPSILFADAVAREFSAVESKIDPATMPFMQTAATIADHVTDHADRSVAEIMQYAESDAICYWASGDDIMPRQKQYWGDALSRLERDFGLRFNVCLGISKAEQPGDALSKLQKTVESLDNWQLGLLQLMTTLTGSALTAFLWQQGVWDAEQVFDQSFVPEIYRAELAGDARNDIPHLQSKRRDIAHLDRIRQMLLGQETVEVRAIIEGRVQGVGYRAWTVKEAKARNIAGNVRNRSNGAVEALFQESAATVADLLRACWRGPLAARVDRIALSDFTVTNKKAGSAFEQLPTL